MKNIKLTICVFASTLSAYIGKLFTPLVILGVVVCIDYLSGMCKAYYKKELSSSVGYRGIIKKLMYFVLVAVGGVLDYIIVHGGREIGLDLSLKYYIGSIVCYWLIINEVLSILENLGAVGVPLPSWLMALVKRLKQTADEHKPL